MAAHQPPSDSPGKNTGVGCHFLLQCMKVKSESEVTQSCPTLSDPMDCSPPGSSIHGIFQARVLEWGAIAFSGLKISIYQMSFSVKPPLCEVYRGLTLTWETLRSERTKTVKPNCCEFFSCLSLWPGPLAIKFGTAVRHFWVELLWLFYVTCVNV